MNQDNLKKFAEGKWKPTIVSGGALSFKWLFQKTNRCQSCNQFNSNLEKLPRESYCDSINASKWQFTPYFEPLKEFNYRNPIKVFSQFTHYCNDCGKTFPNQSLFQKHYEKQNSIRYITPSKFMFYGSHL